MATDRIDLKRGLSRRDAAARARECGLLCSEAFLANLASEGAGPYYRLVSGRAIYLPQDVDAWVISRISGRVRRAADVRRILPDASPSSPRRTEPAEAGASKSAGLE